MVLHIFRLISISVHFLINHFQFAQNKKSRLKLKKKLTTSMIQKLEICPLGEKKYQIVELKSYPKIFDHFLQKAVKQ